MHKSEKFFRIVAILALVVAITTAVFGFNRKVESTATATPGSNYIENYNPAVLYNGGISSALPIQTTSTVTAGNITVGTSGTNLSFIGKGACTLGTMGPASIDASQAATTTKVYDCPFTGVQAGDTIFASIATSTVVGSQGWTVAFAKASSTSGYIEVGIENNTGASVIPSTQSVGSSTVVSVFR